MSAPSITKADDVVEYLVAQHETIKKLFIETLDAPDADTQRAAFTKLRTLLAVHETAEEMIVHPRVRRKIDGGAAVVGERLTEEHDSKVALSEIENLEPGTAEFSKALIHLQAAVKEHAEHEETLEFPALRDGVSAGELAKLAEAVRLAERLAPTHPHPGVELATLNFAVGPFVSMVDRARDALGHVLR